MIVATVPRDALNRIMFTHDATFTALHRDSELIESIKPRPWGLIPVLVKFSARTSTHVTDSKLLD